MDIPDFYRGRSILVTAGTGFIGKATVEKLLRCCPEVERVYLLIRAKRGADPEQRLSEMLDQPVFKGCPVDKVTALAGDLALPLLGLADEDLHAVAGSVSVVLHLAATVNFMEPMHVAVEQNVAAVRHVLQLARRLENLAALVHVSTAYSNCDQHEIHEEVYPAPADVSTILRRAAEDSDALDRETPRMLSGRPNTYSFTKALAENLLVEEAADLPVAIVRPSIVAWALRDPCAGWVDGQNGVVGPFTAILIGTLRSAYCRPSARVDIVPVDLVVNVMLAAAWYTSQNPREGPAPPPAGAARPAGPTVYNCVTGATNPVTWGQVMSAFLARAREHPSKIAIWHPTCVLTPCWVWNSVRIATLMVAPAYLFDAVIAPLVGRPSTLLRRQLKTKRLMECLSFFTSNEWSFADGNVRALWARLSHRDRLLFPFDAAALDWQAYMRAAADGCKRCLLREDVATGPRPGLYLLHRLTGIAIWLLPTVLIAWLSWSRLAGLWPVLLTRLILAGH